MPAIISGLKAFRLAARDNLSSATGPRWLVSTNDIRRFSCVSWFRQLPPLGPAASIRSRGRAGSRQFLLFAASHAPQGDAVKLPSGCQGKLSDHPHLGRTLVVAR
jgi:hypothetical protein